MSATPPLLLEPWCRVDLPPERLADARALDRLGIETALRKHILPLLPAGAVTPVAAPSAGAFSRMEPHLKARLGPVVCQVWPKGRIEEAILSLRRPYLTRRAERRTPEAESCRSWAPRRLAAAFGVFAGLVAVCAAVWPALLVALLFGWTVVTLVAVTGLRTAAAVAAFRAAQRRDREWHSIRAGQVERTLLPRIALLVPLSDETDIAERLVDRLSRLDYPRDKLEACLVLEANDTATLAALRAADLPGWMRIVRVPEGTLRTKPRAMNYALDFLAGEIVGIYDAEDAPAPDQLLRIAEEFDRAGPEVACLQGVLDFYNARRNWLTRCFAIDYAVWFRLVLPGFERLGVVVPLGGTTVFFRRDAIEGLGRWDAHNVTEDADLGLRLARRGYRTRLVPTVTCEEATATLGGWIRQRSRWIKGYAMTWVVHMRDPLRLLGELGPWRFLGVQVLFLGTLSQFLLAPLLWSFWAIPFGVWHPVTEIASWPLVLVLAGLFLASELATMAVAAMAVVSPSHRWLIKWVPLLHFYFPLAAVASWKGLAEMVTRPFYWDKTRHGLWSGERRRWPPARRPESKNRSASVSY